MKHSHGLRPAAVLEELTASLPSFHPQGHRAAAGFEAKARVGNVCLLSTRAGVVDLFGSSRDLASDASAPSATGAHLQQRSAAILRHR